MEDNNIKSSFKWRWAAVVVIIILVVASHLAAGVMSYQLGREHGYSQLEKDIVYAIAINNSKRVGNFLVAKIEDGGTIISLNENFLKKETNE